VLLYHDDDWEGAGREFERAMALGGRQYWMYALYLGSVGRIQESLTAIQRAEEDDPLSLELRRQVADAFACAGRPVEAHERTVELWRAVGPSASRADSLSLLSTLALRAQDIGRDDEAFGWIETLTSVDDPRSADGVQALLLARTGRGDDARSVLARWASESDEPLLPTVLVALGDTAGAMEIMERRAAESPRRWRFFTCSNIYRALRGYPPMEALAARKMGPPV
jgi:tetratricopeptide (TPR) repeat protein